MSWVDEEKAWATVPDAITIVVDKMERVYFEGERRDDIRPTLHSDVALFNGAPVIILHPVGGAKGGYVEHPVYNTGGVGQWQDEQFEIALKNIKAHKWDSYYAKKAGMTVKDWLAQKETGANQFIEQAAQPRTLAQIKSVEAKQRLQAIIARAYAAYLRTEGK
jgi:hypothetical protein